MKFSVNMLTAKDYYYRNIAPEENGMNYQQYHQGYIYAENLDDRSIRVISHIPNLSNDTLIESYINELIGCVDSEIAARLKSIFVAKRKNFFANAGAAQKKNVQDGDLIFFYVGLSDVLFQYAILFTEFDELTHARYVRGDDDPKTKQLFFNLCRDITKLSDAQLEWGIHRNEICFMDETVLIPDESIAEKAVSIATFMDKAVLRHEIAHHLLGHTGKFSEFSEHLSTTARQFFDADNHTVEHCQELEADICGLYLPGTVECQTSKQLEDKITEVALGTLLTQTVLAQLKASIVIDAKSHPSWKTRYTASLNALRSLYGSNHLEQIISDVTRFQVLLYGIQGRGLGEINKELFPIPRD